MKYLEKSFSVFVSNKHFTTREPRPVPRILHPYLPYGAVCYECGLDRVGHETRYGKSEDSGGTATEENT